MHIKNLYITDLTYRKRVSVATKNAMKNPVIKKKLSVARKGKPRCGDPANWKHSEKTKEKLRKAAIKQNSQFWKNKHFSKEHKEKLKIARRKQIQPYQDTSIEKKLQLLLNNENIIFRTHEPMLGQPDIFIEPNICIFADGCYWHACPTCFTENMKSFSNKTSKDKNISKRLINDGYIVLRFWEHEINNNITQCLKIIKQFI